MIVAFQGERGAFSEEAVMQLCGADATPLPCKTFTDVVDAVREGRAHCGVLPVENSSIGAIHSALEALEDSGLHTQSDFEMPIHHCLLAIKSASLADIRTVISHPAALGQCTHYLRSTAHLTAQPWYDTAGAARHVAAKGDRTMAAIASARAAKVLGLKILAENIEDHPDNRTRFVLVKALRSVTN